MGSQSCCQATLFPQLKPKWHKIQLEAILKPCFELLIGECCLSFSALTKSFIISNASLSHLEIFPFAEKNPSAFTFPLFISPEQILLIYLKLPFSNKSHKKSLKKV